MTEYPSSVRPHEALGNTAKEGNKRVQFFPLTGDAGSNMCFEVLQWEPSKMTGDTDKFVPFQPKDGRWICGRKVTINYQQLRFEINDDASFWRAPGGAEASGSLYHWDQGPGGVGGGSLPFKKTHKKEATRVAQRWKVPFSDVDGYEQFCFSVPVLLAFDASGSLTFTEKDSSGEGARNLLAQSTPSASTNPARWAFRLWGPVGLVISLAGGVSLFLVFKSSEETAEFEAVLSPRVSVPPPVLRADPPPPPVARANPAAPPQVANVTWTVQTDAPRLPEPAVENDEEEGHVTHQKGEAETPRKHNVPHKREWALHLKPHDQPKSFERYYFYLPKHRNPHTDNEVNTVLYDSCKPKKSRSLTGRRKRASKRQDRKEEDSLLALPIPSNILHISKRRRSVWKRLSHSLFGKETLPDHCLAIDLVHTTVIRDVAHTHRFILKSVVFTPRPELFDEMAALTPLEDYGPLYDYPRAPLIKTKPYLLWMDVLAPTSVHREWWLEELQALGAVLSNTSDVLLLDHRADPSEEDEADSVPDAPSVPIARPPPSERYWERTVTAAPTAVTAPTVNRIEFVPPCIVPGATGVEGRPVGSPQRPILPIQEEFESSSESYSDAVNASPARLSSPVTDTATSNPAHSSKPSSVRAVGTIPFSATSETSPSTPTPLRRKSSNIYSSTAGSESMRQPQSLPPSNVLFCNDALEERDVRSSAVATIVHDDSAVLAEDFNHFRDAAETTSPPTSTPRPSRPPLSAREIALEAVQAYKASRHRSDSDDEEAHWPSESSSDTVMPARSETNNDSHARDNNNPQNTSTSSVSNYVISRLQNSQDHTATRNLSALLRDSSASRPREGPQTSYGREDADVNAEVSRLRQRIRQNGPWGV